MAPERVLQWGNLARRFATPKLDSDLILAVIWQESEGDEAAYRYEVGWRYFYDPKARVAMYDSSKSVEQNRSRAFAKLGATEFHSQSASFGLMQVMGAVAREHGIRGFVTSLCSSPVTAVEYGCKHLARFIRHGDLREALKRYNGSEIYASEVLAKYDEIRAVSKL